MNPAIELLRNDLAGKVIDQGIHWRILFIGRSVNGTTDIVPCLSRSLRNLGHHVLDIDLRKHAELIDDPAWIFSGHGPVFIKTQPLEQMIRRFAPQMIICCAGGLTFRPLDAEALKQQGIVLIGLTLSDPDVFSTVHPHVGVFDFHTTNALSALSMYREKGIYNTLYFPFGIDRGFVTQQVSQANELAADVICMGHATKRPERNAFMKKMAEQFDVRTYGSGWEIPGSEVVAGERMVKAMRMGKVHVNFPLTHAGHINIKCGVFESIGSGALLCTRRFREMEAFFNYDDEIIGYENEEDLSCQLRAVLDAPERYQQITEKAFRRLINEHLYEHRWMSFFEKIYTVTKDTAPWMSEDRIGAVRTTLSRSYPRARKVIVSGFYGARNCGDELILASIREGLEKSDHGVQVWVAAENPRNVESDHGLQAFARKKHHESLHSLRTASAVIVGGGGLWHDYTFERSGGLMGMFQGATISIAGFSILPLLGRMFDLSFFAVGLGVGPLENRDAGRMVKFVASQAELLYVRDNVSADILKKLNVTESSIIVAPDVAYALTLPALEIPREVEDLSARGYTLIGLNLRPWAGMVEEKVVSAISRALREIAKQRRIAIIGIPMQAGDHVDIAVLNRVAALCSPDVPMVTLSAPLTLEQLTGALSCVDALMSMRLHACLMAHRLRKPAVGLAYDPKVSSHFAELGRSELCIPLTADHEPYVTALTQALKEQGSVPRQCADNITALERKSRSTLARIAECIAAQPAPGVVYEIPGILDGPLHEVVSVPSGTGGAGRKALEMSAHFEDITIAVKEMASPVWKYGALYAAPHELQISLPTEKPLKGQETALSGMLVLSSKEGMEVTFTLESKYMRHDLLGRLFWEVRVGQYVIAEDLAFSDAPVQMKFHTIGATAVPVGLRIYVVKDGPKAISWPKATFVQLKINGCIPSADIARESLHASRGKVMLSEPNNRHGS